jgi:HSP20 family protein
MYSNYYFTLPKVCQPKERSMANNTEKTYRPKMNVQQNDEQITVELSLPGVLKEDVKMNLNDLVLTLEAQRKSAHEQKNYLFREFGSVNLKTKLQIPEDVILDSIHAQFENGVLRISMKKSNKPVIQVEVK